MVSSISQNTSSSYPYSTTKRVLVTGGSGLVGSALKRFLKKSQFQYLTVIYDFNEEHFNHNQNDEIISSKHDLWVFLKSSDGNLCDKTDTNRIFSYIQPTHVIHLAARVGGLLRNLREPLEMFEENLQMNLNVLHACHEFNVQYALMIGSTCTFPDPCPHPITELMLHDGAPHSSNYGYAYAKRMLEIHCRLYREQYGRQYTCLLPTNLYGSQDNFSLEDGHVIPALIQRAWISSQEDTKNCLEVHGDGQDTRQFLYDDDFAIILFQLITYDPSCCLPSSIIIAPPKSHEIKISFVAEYIASKFNLPGVSYLEKPDERGQRCKTVSSQLLQSIIGHGFHYTSITEGLGNVITNYLESKMNGNSVKK